MTAQFDLLIRNAQTRNSQLGLVDIGIAQGKVVAINEEIDGSAEQEINAQGNLVTESFVNPHLHLCKVYTLQMMDEEALKMYIKDNMGKTMNAIELAARVKEKYDESWIIKNVRRALVLAAKNGCTHIRAFADVDSKARLEGVKALIRAREEFRGIVDIQVVAFAQDGIVREPGTVDLMRQAMVLGADVSGGIPWIEYTDADIAEHVKIVFDLAVEFNKDVSMLVDDAGDPDLRSLELMAVETLKRNWHGRSLAHHARAMSMYNTQYFQKLAALLRKSRMGVVSDPHTGPLHARVRELLAEDVLVCLGQDDISDAYYPFGRNNLLEVAFLASHLLWMTTSSDMESLYDMITWRPAKAMNLKDYGLQVGRTAHLVVLREKSVLEALRNHETPLHVISHGKWVDQAKIQQMAD